MKIVQYFETSYLNPVPNQYFNICMDSVRKYAEKNQIEYTLGIHIQNEKLLCIASQNDCNPTLLEIPMKSLVWISLDV